MQMRSLVLAATGAALFASVTPAQSPATPSATFAAPVRLRAGDKFLGEKRLFPSPVLHDVNGDGLADIVVGDLVGRLTVALRLPGDGPLAFAAETKLQDRDAKDLDFHNW